MTAWGLTPTVVSALVCVRSENGPLRSSAFALLQRSKIQARVGDATTPTLSATAAVRKPFGLYRTLMARWLHSWHISLSSSVRLNCLESL